MSLVMDKEMLRSSHWLGSLLSVSPSGLTACWLGDRKDSRPIKILCHVSSKVLFWNRWKKNTGVIRWFTWKMAIKTEVGKRKVKEAYLYSTLL